MGVSLGCSQFSAEDRPPAIHNTRKGASSICPLGGFYLLSLLRTYTMQAVIAPGTLFFLFLFARWVRLISPFSRQLTSSTECSTHPLTHLPK